MSRAARRKAASALTPGTLVANRYRLEQQLGEGGMAEVFRAEEITTGRRVAVKVLRADIAKNPEAVERTKREGELLSQIDNPAIVSVETFGELEDGTVFLVMELLEGETLGARMRRGQLEPAELAPIVAGTCAGLHAAHARGIVHRDLKPDNIFLCPTDYGLQVKLLDFGISKVYGREKLTQTGEILGTPRYMSPEQLGAEPDVDARADVYALGVILYEALAAKPPFLASTPTDLIIAILNGKVAPLRSLRPDLPPGVESVVMRAMSKVRAARFDTAMALAEAYIDAVGGVAAVRGHQRRGMATRAMGGMRKPPSVPPPDMPGTRPPPTPSGGDDVAGHLRIGTFSGLAVDPAAPSGPPIDRLTANMGAASGAPVPDAPAQPVVARPEPDRSWIAMASTQEVPATRSPDVKPLRAFPKTRETPLDELPPPPVAPPRKVAATALMDASQSMPAASLPAPASMPADASVPAVAMPRARGRGGRVLLVLGALLAGALSAGAVIASLHYVDAERRHEGEVAGAESHVPVPATREVDLEPAPTPEPSEPTEGAATSARPEQPSTPPPASDPAEERRPSREPRRHPQSTERQQDPVVHLPGFGDAQRDQSGTSSTEATPADMLRDAQRALQGGQPQRCVDLLDQAIQQGAPTIALRRRGDCLEAAGQREAAVRDYQRFCRLVPDHPAIADVRPLLESWGRSCP